jgi:4'-phosphopantetheinyl transferase
MFEQQTVHILYTKVTHELPVEINKMYLNYLPDQLRVQNLRYRRWQDRASNLLSKILLLKGLQKFGLQDNSLENLRYTEYGRPYLPGNIDFNMSHSGQYILCAVARDLKLGIDIEEIKNVDFAEFEDLMTTGQWQIIRSSNDPLREFFRFWAIKESIIKADGRGLSVPLKEIEISGDIAYYEAKWYLKELQFNEHYCAHLAVNIENPLINYEYIDVNEI